MSCAAGRHFTFVAVSLLVITLLSQVAAQTSSNAQDRYRRLAGSLQQAERSNDFAKAAELYAQLIQIDPKNPQLHRGLGLVSYMGGRYPEAIAALEQAAKLDSRAPGTQLYLGISYYRVNRFGDAIKSLQRSPELSDPKNHLAQYWLGAGYRAEKKLAPAIPHLQAARERAPSDLDVLDLLARTYAEYSAQLLSDLLTKAPEAPVSRLVTAEDLNAVPDAAIEQIDHALADDPSLADAHLLKCQILWTQKRFEEGAEECIRELKANPFSYDAHLRLAAFDLDSGSPRFALEHLELSRRLRPQDASVLDMMKDVRAQVSQAQHPESTKHRCLWGGEVLSAFDRADQKPQQTGKGAALAYWYSAQARFLDAVQLWQTVLDQKPGDTGATYALAKAYDELSAETAGELLTFHPGSYRAHLLRGEAYEKGVRLDLEKALAEYQEAAKLAPDSPGVPYAVGRVFWKMNRFPEAIPPLEKELRISAAHGSAHLLLGKIFLSQRQTGEAIEQLQQALEAQPGSIEVQRELGRALVMQGRYDEGIATYRRILEREPSDASVHALLAIAYRSAGKLDEARLAAEKARALKTANRPKQ